MDFRRPSGLFFGFTIAALGVIGLARGDFTPMWDGIPDTLPGRVILVYLTALLSIVAGAGLVWPRTSSLAAKLLLGSFGAWLLVVRLPSVVLHPTGMGEWWGSGDTALMVGASWAVWGGPRQQIGRTLFGLALIPFGIAHFVYVELTTPLVPHWLPWPTAVAYGTGAAFIAAGVAVVTRLFDRLAAHLVTLQIAGFTVIVWIPILLATPRPHDWLEFYNSWALMAGAWAVAAGYQGMPWLGRVARRGVS